MRLRYSWPLLNVLYDAHFWANWTPSRDDEPSAQKTTDASKLSDADILAKFK